MFSLSSFSKTIIRCSSVIEFFCIFHASICLRKISSIKSSDVISCSSIFFKESRFLDHLNAR